MADDNNIGGKVELDITDFKTNIAQLNREIRVIESGFKATAAGLGDWGASAEGLQARITSLNAIMDAQRQKIENLRAEHTRIAAEQGEGSRAAQDLEIRINNETAALNRNQREISTVTDSLTNFGDETNEAGQRTQEFDDKLKELGGKTAAITKTAMAAIGTAAIAAATGLFKMTLEAGKMADDLITMSNKTGISVQKLQELEYAARFVDVEVDTMTNSIVKLTNSMGNARDGSQDAKTAFELLGVGITTQDGALRDSKQVWLETIDALGRIPNETERDVLALQLFGKSAQELTPLIKAGSTELNNLAAEANNLGVVLSEEEVARLGAFDDAMQKLEATGKALGLQIITAVAPSFETLIEKIKNIDIDPLLNGLKWIKDNSANLATLILGVGTALVTWNVVTTVQGIVTAVKGWQMATKGMTLAQIALNVAMAANPVAIITAAVAGLTAAIMYLWNKNEGFKNAVIETWGTIKDTFSTVVSSIWSFFEPLPARMVEIGAGIINGIKIGIVNTTKSLVNAAANAAKTALMAAKSALGINSPSKVFRDQVGTMIGLGMAEGIKASDKDVTAAMTSLNNRLVNGDGEGIKNNISSIGQGSAVNPLTFTIINQGTLVGTSGMREFSDIISNAISNKLGVSLGGAY